MSDATIQSAKFSCAYNGEIREYDLRYFERSKGKLMFKGEPATEHAARCYQQLERLVKSPRSNPATPPSIVLDDQFIFTPDVRARLTWEITAIARDNGIFDGNLQIRSLGDPGQGVITIDFDEKHPTGNDSPSIHTFCSGTRLTLGDVVGAVGAKFLSCAPRIKDNRPKETAK